MGVKEGGLDDRLSAPPTSKECLDYFQTGKKAAVIYSTNFHARHGHIFAKQKLPKSKKNYPTLIFLPNMNRNGGKG